jgi:hypothetical protein
MTIAEAVATGVEPGDRLWLPIGGWAAELGLTGADAVVRASPPPEEQDE